MEKGGNSKVYALPQVKILPAPEGYLLLIPQYSGKLQGLRIWKTPIIGWQIAPDGMAKPITLEDFRTPSRGNVYQMPSGEVLEPCGELFPSYDDWLENRRYPYHEALWLKDRPKRYEEFPLNGERSDREPAWMAE